MNSRRYLSDEIAVGLAKFEQSKDTSDVLNLISRLEKWYNHWFPNPQLVFLSSNTTRLISKLLRLLQIIHHSQSV